jgi:hypothetical protein
MQLDLPDLPAAVGEELFVADLEPPEHLLEESRGGDRRAELKLMLTKRNRISMERPVVREFSEGIDAETLARLDLPAGDCRFATVLTTVTCLPDPDCRFNWLRVEFELGPELGADAVRPVACRLYPARSEDQVKQVRSVELHGDLTIKVATVDGPTVGRTQTTTTEANGVRYKIMTFGQLSSEPTWHFARTEVTPEVVGDIFLVLVVAMPLDQQTTAAVSLSAEVQLKSAPFALPLLTRRSADAALARSFPLTTSER